VKKLNPLHDEHVMPFGKYKDKPLAEVPSPYLSWLLRECKLSSGLRAAVADELSRRSINAPAAPPPRPIVRCRQHPDAEPLCYWMQDRLGRRRIRAECSHCRRMVDHPPIVEPYVSMADRNASPAPVFDALIQLDALGVELGNDGKRVWIPAEQDKRVPPVLRAIIRQCAHQLATMLADRWTVNP
jgi:hypothetical protein